MAKPNCITWFSRNVGQHLNQPQMRILISIVILCSLSTMLSAQITTDTELWTGGTFKLRLNKNFRIDIEEQLRFNDTISSRKSSFTEFGLKYRINKRWALKGNYRYVVRPTNNNKSRFSLDTYYSWSKKKKPISIQYRLRLQDAKESNTGRKSTHIRNKITVGYNLAKLVDPSISYEIYYRLNQKNEFRTWRLTGGLDWRISKQIDLTTFYRYQKEINVNNPEAQHILGLMLTYGMKIKKEKTLPNKS